MEQPTAEFISSMELTSAMGLGIWLLSSFPALPVTPSGTLSSTLLSSAGVPALFTEQETQLTVSSAAAASAAILFIFINVISHKRNCTSN